MGKLYVGVGGYARKVNKVWVGVGGTARKVKKMWVGVNGVARLCYTSEVPTSVTLVGALEDTIQYTYNGSTETVYFSSSQTSKTITINLQSDSATISFKSTKTNYTRSATITAGVSTTVKVMPNYALFWYGNKDGISSKSLSANYSDVTVNTGYSGDNITITYSIPGGMNMSRDVKLTLSISQNISVGTSEYASTDGRLNYWDQSRPSSTQVKYETTIYMRPPVGGSSYVQPVDDYITCQYITYYE